VWLSVVGISTANPFGEFPYTAVNPYDGKSIEIKNLQDIWDIINSWPEDVPLYEYSVFLAPNYFFVDQWSQELISRYVNSQKYSLAPFAGVKSYDDLPVFFVEAGRIIETEREKAFEYLRLKKSQ